MLLPRTFWCMVTLTYRMPFVWKRELLSKIFILEHWSHCIQVHVSIHSVNHVPVWWAAILKNASLKAIVWNLFKKKALRLITIGEKQVKITIMTTLSTTDPFINVAILCSCIILYFSSENAYCLSDYVRYFI